MPLAPLVVTVMATLTDIELNARTNAVRAVVAAMMFLAPSDLRGRRSSIGSDGGLRGA
jgi:hypothetical protein